MSTPQRKPIRSAADMSRRDFLQWSAGAMGLAALGPLAGCGRDLPLKFAGQASWPGYSLIYLAQKQGWLPENKVALINTANLGESSAMLLNGKVDAAAVTLDEVLHIMDQGVPLKVIAILDVSAGGDAVMAKPGIETLADLKGKTIGVEQSSLGVIMLAKLLQAAGLKREEVSIVPMEYDHLKALEKNNLDAIITYEPMPMQLSQKGMKKIFDSSKMHNMIVDLLAVRTDREKAHAAGLHTLIEGHFKALKLWQHNTVDATYRLAPILGTNAESVKQVFFGINLPDIYYNHHYLNAPAEELQRSAREIASILVRESKLKKAVPLDALFDATYLPEAD